MTVTVTTELAKTSGCGVMVTVRLVPCPPNSSADTGRLTGSELVTLTASWAGSVSSSDTVKSTVTGPLDE